MAIRTNIATPQCPARLPLPGGSCIPGDANWNKIVDSQRFIQQAGIPIFEACSQRNNGQVRPVAGFFGNSFFENDGPAVAPETTAELQQLTQPVELFPGLTKGIMIVTMKLASRLGDPPGSAPTLLNQQLVVKIGRGAASMTIASYRANTNGGFITGIVTLESLAPNQANQIYSVAVPFDFNPGIVPQAGATDWGFVQIQVRKFQPRGTVINSGASYWDGLGHIVIKQYKDC